MNIFENTKIFAYTVHVQQLILTQHIFCKLLFITKMIYKETTSVSTESPVICFLLFTCFIYYSFQLFFYSKTGLLQYVAEPISTSTPQMIYKVWRASNDSQKTMKETKAR